MRFNAKFSVENKPINAQNKIFDLWDIFSLLLLALISLMHTYSSTHAQMSALVQEKIGTHVIETVQQEGSARVVIALSVPAVKGTRSFNLDTARSKILTAQNNVLSSVDNSDFIITHQYRAVPALAGELLTEVGLNKLITNPYVAKVDLDVGGTGSLANSIPLIGADTWHDVGNIGNGVVVAILDSGVDTDHTDLASGIIHQECFIDNNGSIDGSGLCPNGSDRQSGIGAAEDDAGHGTHVTGIIASQGNQSSIGVASGVSIVSIKVTAGPSFSGIFYYFSEIVAALDFIINNRPDVQIINMSLVTNAQFAGDCDNSTSWNMAGAAAINALRSLGVTAFASSGNGGSGTLMASPACLSNVISVGATDDSDAIASFTDSNSSTDILAPGVGIVSDAIGNSTTTASGTSMASPHAAGCAALLIAANEAITPDQIETRLENSPINLLNPKNGLTFPRIDCSLKPLSNVSLSGPTVGSVSEALSFTAAVTPITATQPISYVWQATEQLAITHTNGLSDTVSFSWSSPGAKTITVTVENAGGKTVSLYSVTTDSRIYLPFIQK